VRTVLKISRLDAILIEEGEPAEAPAGPAAGERFERAGAAFELYELARGGSLRCRSVGHDGPLAASAFRNEDCTCLELTDSSFALGIGAIGEGFGECRQRFGELVAVGGAAAYLPADGTGVPDYLMGSGQLMPKLQVLCELAGDGAFARLARFDASASAGSIGLAELARCGLEIAGSDAAGLVIVGEASGLVGAALRRSPAEAGDAPDLFAFPGIRSRLSFTAEPAFARSLTLAVGVVARTASPELRPLSGPADPFGHFHAAAFSFGPLRRGRIDLKDTVVQLFETEKLLGVLHLLNDSREMVGIGQSRFIRGACWIGSIEAGWKRC
jgi:hypothetical protein